ACARQAARQHRSRPHWLAYAPDIGAAPTTGADLDRDQRVRRAPADLLPGVFPALGGATDLAGAGARARLRSGVLHPAPRMATPGDARHEERTDRRDRRPRRALPADGGDRPTGAGRRAVHRAVGRGAAGDPALRGSVQCAPRRISPRDVALADQRSCHRVHRRRGARMACGVEPVRDVRDPGRRHPRRDDPGASGAGGGRDRGGGVAVNRSWFPGHHGAGATYVSYGVRVRTSPAAIARSVSTSMFARESVRDRPGASGTGATPGTTRTRIPAASALSVPASESSMATCPTGETPSFSAA